MHKKISIIIASLLLLSIPFSYAFFSVSAEEVTPTVVTTEAELKTAIAAGGYIQLGNDINITATLTLPAKATTLDLNGYMLRQTNQVSVLNGTGLNGKTLTIMDSRPDSDPHCFIKNETSAWSYDETNSEGCELINGGVITGGYNKTTSSTGGGAIRLNDTSDYVIINGGTIVGNYAARAGGASYGGTLTLNNGKVIGNAAGKFAGAIALSGNFIMNGGIIEDNYSPPGTNEYRFNITDISIGSSSNFTVTGGTIKANIATVTSASKTTLSISDNANIIGNIYLQNGIKANISGGKLTGRIRMTKGSFTMTGGEITDGVANDTEINYFGANGGAVSVEGGNFMMSGGTIHSSTADENGGIVYVNGGTFNMDGGEIYAGKAINGGGIYVNSGTATITAGNIGNITTTNIATTGNGGGIYVAGGNVNYKGGNIVYNEAEQGNGGGIYVSGGTITMSGGTLHSNKATNGGGIYVSGGSITINSGDIGTNDSTSNIATSGNGGGIYVATGDATITGGNITYNKANQGNGGGLYLEGGIITMDGGILHSNYATNGGGVYVSSGSITISSGSIGEENKHNIATTGNGGGIYVATGDATITGGNIDHNKAEQGNGGGLYLEGGNFIMNNGSINYNNSINGGGAYITESTFELNGGSFISNTATSNGGGFYIGDNSTVKLSDGSVGKNTAQNGGGFYQTQDTNTTTTSLSGNCNVYENSSLLGNGGGVYINGGSTFRMIGGLIIYNKSTLENTNTSTIALDSTSGVGGGVYILKGTFSMYDENGNKGTAAIFGNTAEFAADDLFASGIETSFDAIPVLDMEKADAYKTADSWFEDYPINESHITLNYNNRNDGNTSNDTIISPGRYKDQEDVENKIVATTVLNRNCTDYIAITMGNSIGSIVVDITDNKILRAHSFIFRIESCSTDKCTDLAPDLRLEVAVQKGQPQTVIAVPTGLYKITIVPTWSWRYNTQVKYTLTENSITKDPVTNNYTSFNVYTEQSTIVDTSYTITNKKFLSKSIIKESITQTLNN